MSEKTDLRTGWDFNLDTAETVEERLTQLLLEHKTPTDDFLSHMDQFRTKQCEYQMPNMDVQFRLVPFDGISVGIFSLLTANPGSGNGSRFMEFIIQVADRHGVSLRLEAEPFGSPKIPLKRLVAWYNRFGFARTGESPMFSNGVPMSRDPTSANKPFRER